MCRIHPQRLSSASQVYGKNRASPSAKGRWLARGVDTLLFQYPNLRVAFIDGKNDSVGQKMECSVLIRGIVDDQHPQGHVQEVYRCACHSSTPHSCQNCKVFSVGSVQDPACGVPARHRMLILCRTMPSSWSQVWVIPANTWSHVQEVCCLCFPFLFLQEL